MDYDWHNPRECAAGNLKVKLGGNTVQIREKAFLPVSPCQWATSEKGRTSGPTCRTFRPLCRKAGHAGRDVGHMGRTVRPVGRESGHGGGRGGARGRAVG